jgi:hypothetical protein
MTEIDLDALKHLREHCEERGRSEDAENLDAVIALLSTRPAPRLVHEHYTADGPITEADKAAFDEASKRATPLDLGKLDQALQAQVPGMLTLDEDEYDTLKRAVTDPSSWPPTESIKEAAKLHASLAAPKTQVPLPGEIAEIKKRVASHRSYTSDVETMVRAYEALVAENARTQKQLEAARDLFASENLRAVTGERTQSSAPVVTRAQVRALICKTLCISDPGPFDEAFASAILALINPPQPEQETKE